MSLSFTGTGGLFTRLKVLYALIRDANQYSSDEAFTLALPAIASLGTAYSNVLAQYLSNERELTDGLATQKENVRGGLSGWKSYLAQLCQDTLIEQVDRDVTLAEKTVEAAWKEALKQMAGAGSIAAGTATTDVDASTVSASVSAATTMVGARTGNGNLVASVKRPDGRDNELVFNETVEVKCTTSEDNDGAGRAESWSVTGEVAQGDPLHFEWPDGSGANTTLTTVDATQNDSGGNLLANSSFNTFTTTNQPDYWGSALVGAYGTDILEESSTIYRSGTKCLEFVGTGGSPLSSIAQTFAADALAVGTSGTTGTLKPNTVYHWNAYIKKSGSLAAGSINFRLINGSDAAMTDDTGTAIGTTIAHGTLTTSFAAYSGTFVTPKVLPTTGVKFNVRVSVALTSGESVYIADLSFTEATEIYPGGPHLSVHAGSTNPIIGDQWNVTISNGYQGQVQLDTDRVFGMKALGLQLPSDTGGAEAVTDLVLPTYLHQVVAVCATIDPFNGNNATTLSDAIDMSLFSQVSFILLSGANDEAIDFKIRESDASGGTYSDISGKAITQETGGDDDNKQWIITVKASEMGSGMGFLKASVTVGNGTTNMIALVALGVAVTPPATDNDLSSVTQVIA